MKGKYLLGSVLFAVFLTTISLAILNNRVTKKDVINIDSIKSSKSLEGYMVTKGKILELNNPSLQQSYNDELAAIAPSIFTPDVNKVLDGINELSLKRDLVTYNTLVDKLIPKVSNSTNRQFLKNEVLGWGQRSVYTPNTLKAVAAVTKAWTDTTAIKDAEKGVVDNLSYENLWSMYFLEAQLNQIKYEKASAGKNKILIIGDSITAGMGITYTGKQANAQVENAWWQNIDQSKNQVMFLAVGGIGVIQQGLVNNVASDSGFDMLKYAEKVSTMGKNYDKIVIALSTNDYNYSDAEYSKALSNMMDYLKSNYKSKQYILLNFYNHKDAMKEVAKKYSAKYIDVDMTNIDKFDSKIDNTHPSAKGQKQIYELIKSNF